MRLEVSGTKSKIVLVLALAASLLSFGIAPYALRDGLTYREAQDKIIRDQGFPALALYLYKQDAGRAAFAQALYFGGLLGSLLTFYALTVRWWVDERELIELLIVGIVVIYAMNAGVIMLGFEHFF